MNESLLRPKILIVDDKPQNLYALEKLLRQLEVEVIQTTSGSEALGLTLEHDFCLAIADVQMPEMDGYELVELLRGNPSTASLPVIFISAIHSDEYHHRKGYDTGAVDFLSKPFIPEILLSKVRVFLDLYRQRIKLQELVNELNAKNEALVQVAGELQAANLALSKRAMQLEASNQVGQQVTSVLELAELLAAVVKSIQSRFGYYYVGIWLLNEAQDAVVLQAGIGRDGSQCLESGWSIGLDTVQSIIAWVAQSGAAYRAEDVSTDARHLAVEALPATRSEVAVPLRVGEEVMGVLDIQGDRLARFDDEDQRVLQTLANQIAIAIRNARLYKELRRELTERKQAEEALQKAYEEVEKRVEERTTQLQREIAERERLQQEVIEAQQRALQELSTPIIPVMDRIIVMPLVGSIDSLRAKDITRSLLAGIRQHRARVVILDITGVPIVDSDVADHLNKTVQAARLKGARTIVTGISDAVAETIVDLGLDWNGIETLSDLRTGLRVALAVVGRRIAG